MTSNAVEAAALRLLDGALDAPVAEREAWIAAQDAPSEVRQRALRILQRGGGASARLLPTGGAVQRGGLDLPEKIGAYRITGMIGQGGMGAVYEGERAAGDFEHAVAIKVIRPGALSAELADRFRRERQTLARLAHPGIAQLFDGGETADGEPFIVMERVNGVPLDEWVEEAQPSTSDRINLILALCSAVSFAHQNLVIHGDITPSNILVSKAGSPKLIDFGIARPFDPAASAGEPSPFSAAPSLTPGFASPERLTGAPVTTLSDIYSLGKVLQRLTPQAPAELKAVAAKATAANPAERYATVDQLRADLAAYLAGAPVAAFGGGRGYLVAKFAKRHQVGVAAAAVSLVALTAALGLTLAANARAEAARVQAEQRFADVRSLARTLMFDVYDEVTQIPGSTKARLLLAQTAQTYLDRLAADPEAPIDVRLEAGEGYFRLGRVVGFSGGGSLGRREEAKVLLARSERILSDLHAAHPDRDDIKLALGEQLALMAGESLYSDGDSKTGRARAERARALLTALATPSPRSAGALTAAYLYEGDSYGWDNDIPAAGRVYDRGVAVVEAMPRALQESREVRTFLSGLLRQSGEVHRYAGRTAPALARMSEAVAINRLNVSAAPSPGAARKLVASLWSLADMQRIAGRLDAALVTITEAQTLARDQAAKGPDDAGAQESIALAGVTLAQVQSERGAHAAAVAAADEAITLRKTLAQRSGGNKGSRLSWAVGLKDVSEVYRRAGDGARACGALRESEAIMGAYQSAGDLSDFDRENNLIPVRAALKACGG